MALTPKLQANLFLQYNDLAELASVNLRFAWNYRPGSDLFFVYNHSQNLRQHEGEAATNGRNATVKLTWLFSF